ncbi:MAG TPA: GxxExxY protein [Caulobacteraceae bacterium]|nr:GxxExxY protein [Caulobacteraceae bacterium]
MLLLEAETFELRGAFFEVSRVMGHGFLEAVYQECLGLEFERRGIPFKTGCPLSLTYKGLALKQTYVPDYICYDRIVVELKATREVAPEHRSQVLNYLKAANLKLGFLVNFGCAPQARIERLVM